MQVVHIVRSLDPSLIWPFFLLLAFLLVSIAAGAVAGSHVLDGGAPGPLGEIRRASRASEKATGENTAAE